MLLTRLRRSDRNRNTYFFLTISEEQLKDTEGKAMDPENVDELSEKDVEVLPGV